MEEKMDIKIKMPHEVKARVMLWSDISYHDATRLDNIQSIQELETALCEVLDIDLPDPKKSIILNLYVQTMLYCRENHFKPEQTSTLLSIIKSIHEVNVETPMNNIELCHTYCKELLLYHSVRRPPFSIDLFNSVEVTSIYTFIYNSYMRNYKLYKYIFTPQVKLDLSLTYSDIIDQKDFGGVSDDTTEESHISTTEPEGSIQDKHLWQRCQNMNKNGKEQQCFSAF